MMSGQVIAEMSRRAARKSSREHRYPAIVEADDIANLLDDLQSGRRPRFDFPHIGDWCPRGYKKTANLFFVDSSGFGQEGEPALTALEFVHRLREGFAYAVTDAGQFQVYVQEFRPPHQSKRQEAQP